MLLKQILDKYPKSEDYVIEILLEYQETKETNYISEEEIKMITKHLNTTLSHVYSVMSFYTLLSNGKPRGKNIIQVCNDVPCYLNDEINVLETIKKELRINVNQTTKDQLFTLEHSSCIGCCNEGPAMRINNQVFTNLNDKNITEILSQFKGDK